MARFDSERRERFLTLLETGRNVEEAAAAVDVNPSTPARWAARGRAGATAEAAGFAERFDAVRDGQSEARLTEDDVVRALEQAIRKGSVTAIRVWFDRFGAKGETEAKDALTKFDELARKRATR